MITLATGAADLGRYYALGQDDYYQTIRENGFEVVGSGRETYGLEKGIKEEHFRALAGQTWNKDLEKWEGGRDIAAKDLTLEMPKSLSMLYELTEDPVLRAQLYEVMKDTNLHVLNHIEESGIFRVKVHHSDGSFSYHQAENMVVGVVPMHGSSRWPDPHDHWHNLFGNTGTIIGDTSGKEYAVDFDYIKQNRPHLDNVAMSYLADRLRELGVQIEMLPGGRHFRIVGITREQELAFSKRQTQVQKYLRAQGIDPQSATKAQHDAAWQATRGWKYDIPEATLRAKWRAEAQEMGVDLSRAYTPPFVPDPNGPPLADKDLPKAPTFSIQVRNDFGQLEEKNMGLWDAKQHALNSALTDCAERVGVFKRRDVYSEAVKIAKKQGHSLTMADFKTFFDAPAEQLKVFAIGSKCAHDASFIAEKLTTQKFLDAEKQFLEDVKEFAENPSEHALAENAVHKIADWNQSNKLAKGWELKAEQSIMVEALTGKDRIVWVNGRAGAGKTTALQTAADIVGRDNIFGLAQQGKAAQVLQDETGIESSTLDRFLGQVESGDKDLIDRIKGGVLCVDEAGMVGSIHFARLTNVARQYDARIWGVGDPDQLQSVSAGSAMREALARGHGRVVELCEVTRQKDLADRQMVKDIAQHGAVAGAVNHLEEKGYVHEIANREKRHAAMIDKFTEIHAEHGVFAPILTPENKDRVRLNNLIHARLRKDGILKGEEYEFKNLIDGDNKSIGSRKLCLGEKIVFTKNSNEKRHGIDVKNGEVGFVTGVNHHTLLVTIGDREISVDTKKYGYLDQAWAITGYKSQGITEKHVIVDAKGKMMNQNLFYVLVSRFKETCHVFTDDKFKMVRSAQNKQSKMSALGIQEDMAARITGHKYADAITNAFLSREERDTQTRQKIGHALGDAKEAWWHLAPKDLRAQCNKEFDASRNKFAMDLAAAKGGIENDSVTQRLSKTYADWLDKHETLKKNFKAEVVTIKEKGKNVDAKIDTLAKKFHKQHEKNDAKLFNVAAEYNPELAAQLEIKRAIEMHAMDEDSTTLEEKQARVRGEVVDPLPVLKPQAEVVRQAVVIHQDESEKIRKEMRESAKRQERRGRDGLSERQKEQFKKRYATTDEALAAKITAAVGDQAGKVTFARDLSRETRQHSARMAEIKKMKATDAKAAGVKIRDLQRAEMARHHGALDGVVVAHESRSEATREIRDLELAHRERMRELATSRSEAVQEAKDEGRELTPEETKRDSALRNIEEKRFRGELALVGEKHGLTPEYAYDVREHYRQQGKEVHELRQADAGGAREAIEAKRGESDKVLADLAAADRQRPKILSEIRAAQREHSEERRELNRAHAEDAERLNALGVTPGEDFRKMCREEHAAVNASLDNQINGIIDKYAGHDPEAAQALRDTMAAKVADDLENKKLSSALSREHGGYDKVPKEDQEKIVQGYRDNEARRDERLVEIERSMGARKEALAQGQEAPAHSFGEIKPHDARPEIIRDIQSTLEAHESKKYELKRAQKEEGDKLQTEGKELSKEWNDAWNAKYQNANAEFQREINQVVEKYAGKDPQAAAEIRSALDEQRVRDVATRKESGALARAHGNDFKKVPVAERDKIVAQYREHEQHRNDRLMAAQRGIVERQLAAPSPAPSLASSTPEPAAKMARPAEGLTPDHRPAEPVRPRPVEPEQAQAQAPQAEHQAQHSPSLAQPEPPKVEQLAPMERQAEHGQAKPQPEPSRSEPERPKVAPISEPIHVQHSPSPTMATPSPEPAKLDSGGPEFSHGGMSLAARPEPPQAMEQPVAMQHEQAQAPQAEHSATMDRPAEGLTLEHRPAQQPQARPEPSKEPERPKVAEPEPSRSQPSPTLASSTPEPAAKLDSGPEFSHGKGSLGEKTQTVSPGQMSKGTEPPAHLTTTPEIRAWWDDQRSKVSDAAETPQEAPGAKQSGIDGGKVAESPKAAVQAPQTAKVAINLPPPPDWNQRYADASAKAARDIAVEKLAAGPAPVPAKPAEDVVAKAQAEAKALEAAMRESRERETQRMKERARQDAEKYGPRVAAASDEIIRGTVVEAQIKGGRLNVVVDCGNGRYRVAALPASTNVNIGQSGEFRQQKNNVYSFAPGNLVNMQAVKRFDNNKNSLQPVLNSAIQDVSQKLALGKKLHLGR